MSFYRKYRPKKFKDLIGQDHIRDTLLFAFKRGQISHAYLFTGPRGTGKTSTARLIAKTLNCQKFDRKTGEPCNICQSCKETMEGRSIDIIEIDAASNRGIEEIRELRENVKFAPTKSKYKVFIIDEVHMLTREAFNALLKTLEEPPEHAIFILATTEVHKVPATVISRTQRFDFARIKKDDLIKYLKKVAKSEKLEVAEEAYDLIAVIAEGGHRDAVSLLEQVSVSGKKITLKKVRDILGITEKKEVFTFLEAIFNTNSEEGLKIAQNLFAGGKSMAQFNKEIIEVVRKILLYKATEKVLFDETKENVQKIIKLSKSINLVQTRKLLEIFIESGSLLKDVSYPIMPIEMAAIEASHLFGKEVPITNPKSQIPNSKQSQNSSDQTIEKEERSKKPTNDSTDDLPPTTNELTILSSKQWNNVVALTKKENNTLAALLRDARPIAVKNDQIVLGVKFQFHRDKISETKNIQLIEKFATEILGKKCRIACQISDMKKKKTNPASDDELLEAADEIFG